MSLSSKYRMQIQKKAVEFLKQHHTAVLATTSGTRVHSAAVMYLMGENNEIYFLTREKSTKYRNILKNSMVSMVVYKSECFPKSVQIEGVARAIVEPRKTQKVIEQFVEKVWYNAPYFPPVFKLCSGGKLTLFKVKMKRIQLLEDAYHPEQIVLENVAVQHA